MKKKAVYGEEMRELRNVPVGEYVRVVSARTGKPQNKVYINEGYDPGERKFTLIDAEDINSWRMVKGSHTVFVGFTY